MKMLAKLGGLRLIAMALTLLQSVFVVRFMTLEEIGRYYVMATVAYLGNASIFVGTDLYLQRKLANLSVAQELNQVAFFRYITLTTLIGGGVVVAVALPYYYYVGLSEWLFSTLVCATLTMATYLSGIGRNLCQLAGHPVFSNIGPLTEGLFRVGILLSLAYYDQANAITVASASACGSIIAAFITIGLLLRTISHINNKSYSYIGNNREIRETVLSVGVGGILNWTQLQGYRPFMLGSSTDGQVIGSVAFLTTLGSTAANAVFTILAQIQIPKLYNSRGNSTIEYLQLIGVISIGLAVACIPAGAAFLSLTAKTQLMKITYLVAIGVLIEAGNAAIGVCTHHKNVLGQKMWLLSLATFMGCFLTYILLVAPIVSDMHIRVAMSLLAGQALTVASTLYFTFIKSEHMHA